MSVEVAGSQLLLRGVNRMAVVRQLCVNPGLSRSDLSACLGLTRSTVTTLVRDLLADGWLVEREVVTTGDPGRRPTPLFIDPHRLLLLGAEVSVKTLRVVAVSLAGEVLGRLEVGFDRGAGAAACVDGLSRALLALCEEIDEPWRRPIGIGVGLPGGVDEARGILHFAPNLGWRDVPLGALLMKRLSPTPLAGIALFVQNEADVAAVGEIEFNASRATSPLLYLSINQGLGAGMVVRDKLVTGHRGFAGEVGHIVLQVDGPRCTCGRRGCAEALINTRAALGTDEAVAEAGRYLGVLLQNLATAYDPGCIVLGGELVALGEPFLGSALQTLREYADAARLSVPDVRITQLGADAVAIGAAALARYRLTQPHTIGASRLASPSAKAQVPLHRFQRLTPRP
ncbi:ROK family transcriptional regulator [Ideonella sp. YS5]|uniref:ROK family transcriptional regulator n=1 Tax=Ideonella sp. YS5 TaxID=3453714 RepID=UPI003EEA32B6